MFDYSCISIHDENYPKLLRDIPNPPTKLYYKGDIKSGGDTNSGAFDYCLSVVGSREISNYGKRALVNFFKKLDRRIIVVSGFMTGVDSLAHELALYYGHKTIAILPCGVNNIYPKCNKKLYFDIIENGGLVISEYEKNINPEAWVFPRRNRIIAGLSKALIVVEAQLNSGSLNCASCAHLFNREVYTFPRSIFSSKSLGSIKLLNSVAHAIDDARTINNSYGIF